MSVIEALTDKWAGIWHGSPVLDAKPIMSAKELFRVMGLRAEVLARAYGIEDVQFASLIGISKQSFWKKKNAIVPFSPYEIYRLCVSAQVTADYLYRGDYSGAPAWLAERLAALALSRPEARLVAVRPGVGISHASSVPVPSRRRIKSDVKV